MSFELPEFTVWKLIYTGIGAAVFWGVWGRSRLKPFILFDLFKNLPVPEPVKEVIEFLVFIALGCLVGIGFTDPVNPRQALTAGFGWTGAFARIKKSTR